MDPVAVRAQIRAYLSGDLTLAEFDRWVGVASPRVVDPDDAVFRLTAQHRAGRATRARADQGGSEALMPLAPAHPCRTCKAPVRGGPYCAKVAR